MNLAGNTRSDLLFATFNQDASCLSIGTTKGFLVFRCNPFSECYKSLDGGIGIAEMLFCSSLVGLVGSGDDPTLSPRKLRLCNTKTNSTICELNFVTCILGVRLNKKRLAVVMETKIHIYDVTTMKILHTIDTVPNPNGLCALSPADNSHLAYPSKTNMGEVIIFDALSLRSVSVINAHKGPLACLSFNHDGTLLATASTKGTIVRTFSAPRGEKRAQFRRGSSPATVYSIKFNPDSTLLCASSDSGTIHIFTVPPESPAPGLFSSYMPESWSEMVEPKRSFAWARLPHPGVLNVCAFSETSRQMMVCTSDGFFFHYNIDPQGGEAKLVGEWPLLENGSDPQFAAAPLS